MQEPVSGFVPGGNKTVTELKMEDVSVKVFEVVELRQDSCKTVKLPNITLLR